MRTLISPDEIKENFSNYTITDCAVRNKNLLYFMASNVKESENASVFSENTVTKRLIIFDREEPYGANSGHQWFKDWSEMLVAGSHNNENKIVCVAEDGAVFAAGEGKTEKEKPIPKSKEGPYRGSIRRIRMIHGVLYAVGTTHTVCRRRGRNDWESVCLNLPLGTQADHDDEKRSEDMAFEDIDGFSHDDLYVIAGRGVLWHCNGKTWRQIDFPSNMYMHSICCAGDGNVYIGAQSGTLFRGRGDKWEMVERGDMTLPFKDLVWYRDRLWGTSDYGLWTLEGDSMVRADVPSEITVCAGNLSVADGVMLLAGTHGAAFHDSEKWQLIFNFQQVAQEN